VRSFINILYLFDNIYVLYLRKTVIVVDRKLKPCCNLMFFELISVVILGLRICEFSV
jgi:hypothetical protein